MISREEAIDIIMYASAFNSENSPLTKALDMAIEALRQDERPKGRWVESIVIQTDTSELCECTCSVCSIVTTRKSNFCPNCGADMRGEE